MNRNTTHRGWINIYRIPVTDEEGNDQYETMTGNTIYPTRAAARGGNENMIDTIEITWKD